MTSIKPDLNQQLRGNRRKSALIVSIFILIVAAFGGLIGLGYAYYTERSLGMPTMPTIQWGVIITRFVFYALVVGIIYVLFMMHKSVSIVAAMNHAHEVTDGSQYPVFCEEIKDLCLAAGLPANRFRLFIIDDPAPNAFSVGTLCRKGAGFSGEAGIGVTTGMLKIADKYELLSVLGHEMSHIVDQDTRVETIGIALTSLFAIIGDLMMRLAWYSSWTDDDDDNDNDDGAAITAILFAVGIIGFLCSGVSYLTQLCLSRNREYLADAGSVNLTRNPKPLISIFRKLEAMEDGNAPTNNRKVGMSNNALFMVNPHTHHESFIARIFDTHPPLDDRIKRLEEM